MILLAGKYVCTFVYLVQKPNHPCPSALNLLKPGSDWTGQDCHHSATKDSTHSRDNMYLPQTVRLCDPISTVASQ